MVEENINQKNVYLQYKFLYFDVILSLKVYNYGGLINE